MTRNNNTKQAAVIVSGMARTPLGGLQGVLAAAPAPELGAAAIAAAVERSGARPADIDACMLGCVLPAGQGQAPARQAALKAGLPQSVNCVTINKMCGSGMQAVILAMDAIRAGSAAMIAAGGMESMSNAPYLLPGARAGMRMGHGKVIDHMFHDGLEDAYDRGRLMGAFAEECAEKYRFSREQQDEYAIESLTRAQIAIKEGKFRNEIVPITIRTRKGEHSVDTDEQPGKADIEKIPALKPAFAKGGSVTAANSSSISDGAAALILADRQTAAAKGLTPLCELRAHAAHAHEPAWFTTAPVDAIRKVMAAAGWKVEDVDLFEVNEAFAVVAMAAMRELSIPHEKLNPHGGACALGHPIGASGARILVTLIAALQERGLRRGVAGICIGGGEATAVAVEMV